MRYPKSRGTMTQYGKSHDMNRKVGEQCDGGVIDVESTTGSAPRSTVAAVQHLTSLVKELCNKGNTIKSDICSALSKTSLKDVQPKEMTGKGNIKISKDFLAENILALLKYTTALNPIVHEEISQTDLIKLSNNVSVDTSELKQFITDVEGRLLNANSAIENNARAMDNLLMSMKSIHENISVDGYQPPSNISPPGMRPNTETPRVALYEEGDPYVKYENNCIEAGTKAIMDELNKIEGFNKSEKSDECDTLYFGEYRYRDNGTNYDQRPLPQFVSEILEQLRPYLSNTKAKINSCIIKRYKGGYNSGINQRDNALVFDPESESVTLSIGAKLSMKFSNNSGTKKEEVLMEDGSVLVTTRRAQDFWTYNVEKDAGSETSNVSYTLTFRHVAPHFINSTVIIGDSNTRFMSFGEGRGKFGVWLPGKRLEAFCIEDIPNPVDIGPYRNIVLHAGVNNIKRRDRRSNISLANELDYKCKEILELYPRSRIYLSLLLPTKLESLNYRAKELNNMLIEISHSNRNVFIIEHPRSLLCNSSGFLKPGMGRFDKGKNVPLDSDSLHLGIRGIRILAKTIKEAILPRNRGMHRYQVQGTPGTRAAPGLKRGINSPHS